MNNHKNINWKVKLVCAILFSLVPLVVSSLEIKTQAEQIQLSPVHFNQPILSSRGAPGDRKGGGRREVSNCQNFKIKERIIALVPEFQDTKKITHVWGLTTQDFPKLWFYVPYKSNNIAMGRLEIWDETSLNPRKYQQIYKGKFNLSGTPGVISLDLPSQLKLHSNKNYHWYFYLLIRCGSQDIPLTVNGWIEKVKEVTLPLALPSEREQIIFYAQNGIWYDALTLLGQLRTQNSENAGFAADWEKLLADVGLGNISKQPIIPCCTLQN